MLTTSEKKRILLNNIYGLDIDSQAVEVTKLSLLLKVLENENQETLKKQLSLWRERALPDLRKTLNAAIRSSARNFTITANSTFSTRKSNTASTSSTGKTILSVSEQ